MADNNEDRAPSVKDRIKQWEEKIGETKPKSKKTDTKQEQANINDMRGEETPTIGESINAIHDELGKSHHSQKVNEIAHQFFQDTQKEEGIKFGELIEDIDKYQEAVMSDSGLSNESKDKISGALDNIENAYSEHTGESREVQNGALLESLEQVEQNLPEAHKKSFENLMENINEIYSSNELDAAEKSEALTNSKEEFSEVVLSDQNLGKETSKLIKSQLDNIENGVREDVGLGKESAAAPELETKLSSNSFSDPGEKSPTASTNSDKEAESPEAGGVKSPSELAGVDLDRSTDIHDALRQVDEALPEQHKDRDKFESLLEKGRELTSALDDSVPEAEPIHWDYFMTSLELQKNISNDKEMDNDTKKLINENLHGVDNQFARDLEKTLGSGKSRHENEADVVKMEQDAARLEKESPKQPEASKQTEGSKQAEASTPAKSANGSRGNESKAQNTEKNDLKELGGALNKHGMQPESGSKVSSGKTHASGRSKSQDREVGPAK